jgi:hypothetical protein
MLSAKKHFPQRLKPGSLCVAFGMTEVMPFYKAGWIRILRQNEAVS